MKQQNKKRKNSRGRRLLNALNQHDRLIERDARPRALRRLSDKIDRLKLDYDTRAKKIKIENGKI